MQVFNLSARSDHALFALESMLASTKMFKDIVDKLKNDDSKCF